LLHSSGMLIILVYSLNGSEPETDLSAKIAAVTLAYPASSIVVVGVMDKTRFCHPEINLRLCYSVFPKVRL
jgi:hypothetical protein